VSQVVTTRQQNWRELVREAEGKDYDAKRLRPHVYEFAGSNRLFYERQPVYDFED
jgi:hypothetical protein